MLHLSSQISPWTQWPMRISCECHDIITRWIISFKPSHSHDPIQTYRALDEDSGTFAIVLF